MNITGLNMISRSVSKFNPFRVCHSCRLYTAQAASAASAASPTAPDLKTALKSLYKRIHPDLFYADVAKRDANAAAFAVIQSLVSDVTGSSSNSSAKHASPRDSVFRPKPIEIYVRDEDGQIQNSPLKVTLLPGHRGIISLFQTLGLQVPQLPTSASAGHSDAAIVVFREGTLMHFLNDVYSPHHYQDFLYKESQKHRLQSALAVKWKVSRLGIYCHSVDVAIESIQAYSTFTDIQFANCQVRISEADSKVHVDSYGRIVVPVLKHNAALPEGLDRTGLHNMLEFAAAQHIRAERIKKLEQSCALHLRVGLACAESLACHSSLEYERALERILAETSGPSTLFSAVPWHAYQKLSLMITDRSLPAGTIEAPTPGIIVMHIAEPTSTLLQYLHRCGKQLLKQEREHEQQTARMLRLSRDVRNDLQIKELTFERKLTEEQLKIACGRLKDLDKWREYAVLHIVANMSIDGDAFYVDQQGRACVYWNFDLQ